MIDCLLIGHNTMDFSEYERNLRKIGIHSNAYRDLNLNFLHINDQPMHLGAIFNLYGCRGDSTNETFKPVSPFDSFSATIAYLGTFLAKKGITFDYIHSFQDEKEELKEILIRKEILTIAITTTYYVFPQPILEIVHFIKQYNDRAKIIIGGPFIATQVRSFEESAVPEYLFKLMGGDFYVNSSQGEETLLNIILTLKKNLSPDQIKNIYYKTSNGYRFTPTLKENNRLSENMVDWGLFAHGPGEYVNVRTSISCPFSCAFCGFPQHAGEYQTIPVPLLEKELQQLSKINSLKGINFIDDTFNVPPRRIKEICRMMIRNNYSFRWFSNFRCQYADREMVELMKQSGCEGVFLGLESGSNKILKNMNKAATVQKYAAGIALLNKYEIMTMGSFIVGFPGETRETLQETKHFLEESGLDFFRANLWYCERITPIRENREKYNLKGENFEWSHFTMNSQEACHWVEELFCTIKNPIWVPLYHFDIETIWHLGHQRMSLTQIRELLNQFNRGIKDKLKNPAKTRTNFDILRQIQRICSPTPVAVDNPVSNEKENVVDRDTYAAEFNFQ